MRVGISEDAARKIEEHQQKLRSIQNMFEVAHAHYAEFVNGLRLGHGLGADYAPGKDERGWHLAQATESPPG